MMGIMVASLIFLKSSKARIPSACMRKITFHCRAVLNIMVWNYWRELQKNSLK